MVENCVQINCYISVLQSSCIWSGKERLYFALQDLNLGEINKTKPYHQLHRCNINFSAKNRKVSGICLWNPLWVGCLVIIKKGDASQWSEISDQKRSLPCHCCAHLEWFGGWGQKTGQHEVAKIERKLLQIWVIPCWHGEVGVGVDCRWRMTRNGWVDNQDILIFTANRDSFPDQWFFSSPPLSTICLAYVTVYRFSEAGLCYWHKCTRRGRDFLIGRDASFKGVITTIKRGRGRDGERKARYSNQGQMGNLFGWKSERIQFKENVYGHNLIRLCCSSYSFLCISLDSGILTAWI